MSEVSTNKILPAPPVAVAAPEWGLRGLVFVLLTIAVGVVFLLELTWGVVNIPVGEIVRVLVGGETSRETWTRIVVDLRLPRALTALVAGAALGASGLMMQTLFRNPLASAWTLGLAGGAELGVAALVAVAGAGGAANFLANFSFLGNASIALAASAGATLALLFILSVSRRVSSVTLLVVGLMTHYLAEGFVSVLLHLTDAAQVKVFESWFDGNFAGTNWSQIYILIPVVVVGLVAALLMVKPLNALLLGENYARTLGVSVAGVKIFAFVAVAVLAGAVTAYCGPIVFLGLAVPHLCRGLFNTSDHRALMPATVLLGSFLALCADFVAHLDWGQHVFHLNTVNALIGAPVVLWVILRRKNGRSLEL